jgi:multiple sugar transport system ATP-binding protein
MASIAFESVSKTYSDGYKAVRNFNAEIRDGEFAVLVGPSGCGKSTTLRMVAGLEDISDGRLIIGGKLANDLSPRERNIAMVFQSYALYPHLTVAENIGFGLKVRGISNADIQAKVEAAAKTLELKEYLSRRPGQLSGGQRQRVAMGRAIVREPQAFLMDEPLSNLDARLRVQMRAEIARIQKMTGVTTIYVTHDQVEAMTMGDRVIAMNHGIIQQDGPPRTLYDAPANIFVATFIGSPAMNLIEGRLDATASGLEFVVGPWRLPLPKSLVERKPGLSRLGGRKVVAGIRPEHVKIAESSATLPGMIAGRVAFVADQGSLILVHLDIDTPAPRLDFDGLGLPADTQDVLKSEISQLRISLDGSARVSAGEKLCIIPDLNRLHLFDQANGLAIGT